jgi:hypothetical protein
MTAAATSTTFQLYIYGYDSDTGIDCEVPHLTSTNYLTWSSKVEIVLRCENLLNVVNGSESPPPLTASHAQRGSFRDRQHRALKVIQMCAPSNILCNYGGPYSAEDADPKELWDAIREGYRRTLHVWRIRRELYGVRLEDFRDVMDYTMKIDALVRKYNFAKGDREDMAADEHTFFYLNGLSESWKEAEMGFWLNDELVRSPEKLEKAMRAYETNLRWAREDKWSNVTCYRCQQKGHYRNQCPN